MSETISLSNSQLRVIVAAILATSSSRSVVMGNFRDFLKQLTEKDMKDEPGGSFSL